MAGGLSIAAIGAGDLAYNLVGLAQVGLPENLLWAPLLESAGIVVAVAILCFIRPSAAAVRENLHRFRGHSPALREAVWRLLRQSIPSRQTVATLALRRDLERAVDRAELDGVVGLTLDIQSATVSQQREEAQLVVEQRLRYLLEDEDRFPRVA